MYQVYLNNNVSQWSNLWMQMGELLAHELGHTLGLSHSWVDCGTSIPDIIPCPNNINWCSPDGPSITPPCLNNTMGYSSLRRWFSPKQIGRMHRNLTNRDIARFVRHELVSGQNITVSSSQTWATNRFVFGDITVQTGSTLTINSKVFMPIGSKIIVQRGARLYLSCANLMTCRNPLSSLKINANGDYWDGIKVWGNTTLPHLANMYDPQSSMPATYAGRVISDKSEIDNAVTAISTSNPTESWPNSQYYYGGYIYATETIFKNNKRGVAFMKYDFDNLSLFQKCQFISDNNNSFSGITMWGIKKFYISECTFSNLLLNGLLGWDANFQALSCTFTNVHHGMESYSSSPLTGVMVASQNTFTNCNVGLEATNSLASQNLHNTFNNNYFGTAFIGDTRFLDIDNDFLNCVNGVNAMVTGFNGDNQIRCNDFVDNTFGIVALGENEGLRFIFNHFDNPNQNGDNVEVTYYAGLTSVHTGKIRAAQSWQDPSNFFQKLPAGNLFTSSYTETKRHIVTVPVSSNTNQSEEFTYHHTAEGLTPRVYPYCGILGNCPPGVNSLHYKFSYVPYPFIQPDECHRSLSGYCANVTCYANILSDYNTKKQEYISTPTFSNKEIYHIARTEKYNALDTIVRDYLNRGDYLGLDQLLQNDSETYAKRARIGIKILQSDFNGARSLLSAYPIVDSGDQDFVDIQAININRLQYGSSLSSQDISTLQNKITSKSIEQGYARAILSHMLDSIYEPELGNLIITPRSSGGNWTVTSDHTIKIFPNPTTGLIDLEFDKTITGNQEYVVSIFSTDGREIYTNKVDTRTNTIDLSNSQNGIYWVKVYDTGMNPIFNSKLVLIH